MQKHMIQALVIKVLMAYSGENGTYWCYFDTDKRQSY